MSLLHYFFFFLIWPLFKRLGQKLLHIFFCFFVVDLNTPKGHLEIYWPLGPAWIPLWSCIGTKRTDIFFFRSPPWHFPQDFIPFCLGISKWKFQIWFTVQLWALTITVTCKLHVPTSDHGNPLQFLLLFVRIIKKKIRLQKKTSNLW